MVLESEHSWSELAGLFADRVEEHGFIDKKDWNREHFITWFMIREPLGLRFDWRMIARCYTISKDLNNKHDHFTCVIGGEGSGKTTFLQQINSWVSPSMDMQDIVFDMKQYIIKLKQIAKDYKQNKIDKNDKCIQIDEGGISLFSREAMSLSNRVLAKTFMVQRFLNVHVGICIPHYWSIDPMIRNHRVNTLIMIHERGTYKCIVSKGINIMNKLGAKDKEKDLWIIPIPYGLFWEGHFRKDFTNNISMKEYEKHKFKHIQNFLDDAEKEATTTKMVKVNKIVKDFGISRITIIKQIQAGKIQGTKIGDHWWVSEKAYKQLTFG